MMHKIIRIMLQIVVGLYLLFMIVMAFAGKVF